jgi:putative ABC transport system permease protein
VETLWNDIRFGLRGLAKSPGFTAVAVLSLALGIGANTALFSLVNGLLLRHLPVTHPEQLAAVGLTSRVGGVSHGTPQFGLFSLPLYYAVRDANHSFSGLLATGRTGALDLSAEGSAATAEVEHPRGRLVTGNYFSVLGVHAAAGRTFTEQDDRPGGVSPPTVVLAYQYWQRRFGLDPGVVGKRLKINGGLFTIIGVAAPDFTGEIVGAHEDLWIPVTQQPLVNPGRNWLRDGNTNWLLLMGRLKPGVTVEQAKAEIDPLAHRLVPTLPGIKLDQDDLIGIAGNHVNVSPGGLGFSSVRARFSQPLLLLFGMVGVVLLICCANIANLLLTRAAGRSREIGVRLAIGAGRGRLVRQLLTESVLLALVGTACGAVLAVWASQMLLELASSGPNPIPLDVHPDLRVLAFTLGITMLTAVLFGLAPGLRAVRVDLISALKPSMGRTGQAGGSRGKFRAGKVLVVAQVAISLLLLTGAGLLARSLNNLMHQDVGFDRDHLLIVETDPVASGYNQKQMDALMRDVTGSLGELPGVGGVVSSYNGLFSGTDSETLLGVGDLKRTGRNDRLASYDEVGPDYFRIVGAHILRGRGIGPQDTAMSPKVAVLGEAMARYLYPGIDPIGHHIIMGDAEHPVPVEVVGVVNDIKENGLAEEASRRFFLPITQLADDIGYLRFILRTPGEPGALKKSVQARMRERFPNLQVTGVSPVLENMRDDITEQRMLAQLSSLFGGLALVLAVTGLYGVMSYTTSLRTNEIGIRMALGAERGTVLRMVLGESLGLLGVGIVLGLALAAGALRVLSSRLFGLSATDPLTFAASVSVLGVAVLLAGYLPARRASRVNPLVALRDE